MAARKVYERYVVVSYKLNCLNNQLADGDQVGWATTRIWCDAALEDNAIMTMEEYIVSAFAQWMKIAGLDPEDSKRNAEAYLDGHGILKQTPDQVLSLGIGPHIISPDPCEYSFVWVNPNQKPFVVEKFQVLPCPSMPLSHNKDMIANRYVCVMFSEDDGICAICNVSNRDQALTLMEEFAEEQYNEIVEKDGRYIGSGKDYFSGLIYADKVEDLDDGYHIDLFQTTDINRIDIVLVKNHILRTVRRLQVGEVGTSLFEMLDTEDQQRAIQEIAAEEEKRRQAESLKVERGRRAQLRHDKKERGANPNQVSMTVNNGPPTCPAEYAAVEKLS